VSLITLAQIQQRLSRDLDVELHRPVVEAHADLYQVICGCGEWRSDWLPESRLQRAFLRHLQASRTH
jgi:hypothetical protein